MTLRVAWDDIPASVQHVSSRLLEAGYQAYLVGGCIRDLLLGRQPNDWDIATDALPDTVANMFERTYRVGAAFGTVVVLAPEPVEVTTFRKDFAYEDGRRPAYVEFATTIEEDLARRDFTMNALAYDLRSKHVVDPFGGTADIARKIIRTVGVPADRFREDALRMLRAVRFVAALGFTVESDTRVAIEAEVERVHYLSAERIRDEILGLLVGPYVGDGLWLLYEVGLLERVLPELSGADKLPQMKPGAPTLLAHLIRATEEAPPRANVRFAALFHDVGKMATRQELPDGRIVFHGHERVGEEIIRKACRRLRMERRFTEHVASLVHMHMVEGDVTKKAVRRWVGAYGEAWVRDLIALRRADHLASGGDDAENAFPRHLEALLEEVLAEKSAFTVKDLAIDGHDVMERAAIPPGPEVGEILDALLERVLDDPSMNDRETLLKLVDIERQNRFS